MSKEISYQRHLNNFDLIRFIAASFVIITHSYSLIGSSQKDWLFQSTNGSILFSHLGVAIFFVISGYLITQSAISAKNWRGYLWKRILRLIPGLSVALLFCAFIIGPLFTNLNLQNYFANSSTYHFLLSDFIYIRNYALPDVFIDNPVNAVNGSLWTLAYEFTLYLFVLFLLIIGILKKRILFVLMLILFFGLRIYLGDKYFIYNYASPLTLNLNIMFVFEWSFYFLSGMIFFLFKDKKLLDYRIVILLILIYSFFSFIGEKKILDILNYLVIPYLVFFFAFIPGKLNNFSKYGDFSYGLYIYAFPIQQSIIYLFHNQISVGLLILLSLVTTIPFAILSWHFIEKKALQYKNLFN